MICVLFSMKDVRLGQVMMPDSCRIIAFGGAIFVRTDVAAALDDGGFGIAFEAHDRYVIDSLDVYNPRSPTSGKVAGKSRDKAVQARPAAGAKVDRCTTPLDDEGAPR